VAWFLHRTILGPDEELDAVAAEPGERLPLRLRFEIDAKDCSDEFLDSRVGIEEPLSRFLSGADVPDRRRGDRLSHRGLVTSCTAHRLAAHLILDLGHDRSEMAELPVTAQTQVISPPVYDDQNITNDADLDELQPFDRVSSAAGARGKVKLRALYRGLKTPRPAPSFTD
jgi:hypothetical protein